MKTLTKVVPTHPCCICLEDVTDYVQCDVCLEGTLCRYCALLYDVEICPVCRQVNTNIRRFKSSWTICFENCIVVVEVLLVTFFYFALITAVGAVTAALFDFQVYDVLNYIILGLLTFGALLFVSFAVIGIIKVYHMCKSKQKKVHTDMPMITPAINPTHSSQIRIRLNY